jgi:hypothetical protein
MPHNLKATDMIAEILKAAKEDGIISEDEQALIDSIQANIAKYYRILDKSYEDGVITSDEEHNFYEARKIILEEALKVAREDEQITQDEFRIIKVLRHVIRKMEENEHY